MPVDVERWTPVVHRVARATRVQLDVEDRVQEGWVACLEALNQYDANRTDTGIRESFVAQRIRWRIIDAARRHARRYTIRPVIVSLGDHDPGQADETDRVVDVLAVRQSLDGPDVEILKAWSHGRTLAQIGADYGVTESRACQRFRRGCETLAQRLAD